MIYEHLKQIEHDAPHLLSYPENDVIILRGGRYQALQQGTCPGARVVCTVRQANNLLNGVSPKSARPMEA